MGSEIIVVIVVATALTFDFTNGFHDTANVVATSISTRAMAPRIAVGYAAILNFVGAFISLEVAATVAQDVVQPGVDQPAGGLRRTGGGNCLEPHHLVLRPPIELVARPHRRHLGAVFVADGPSAIFFEEGILGKVMIPSGGPPNPRLRGGEGWRSCSSTGSSAGCDRVRLSARLSRRAGDLRRAARARPLQ